MELNTTMITNISASPVTQSVNMMNYVKQTPYGWFVWFLNPAIFTLGILGNFYLISSIFARKLYKKSPIFIFLGFISVSDTVALLSISGIDMLEMMGLETGHKLFCTIKFYFSYACSKISVNTLIAAYIFKLKSLLRPLELISANQTKRTVLQCAIIVVFWLLAECYILILGVITHTYISTSNLNGVITHNIDCVFNPDIKSGFHVYLPIITIVLYVGIPGGLLTLLSIAILIVLRRSHQQHKQLTQSDPQAAASNDKSVYTSAQQFAQILIAMSVLHIATTVVRYIDLAIYFSIGSDIYGIIVRYFFFSRCVTSLNFSMNFYVQIVCSKFFRDAMFPWLADKK